MSPGKTTTTTTKDSLYYDTVPSKFHVTVQSERKRPRGQARGEEIETHFKKKKNLFIQPKEKTPYVQANYSKPQN